MARVLEPATSIRSSVRNGTLDAVLALEKSRFIEPYQALRILEGIVKALRILEGVRAGLIVYGGYALPLLNPTTELDRVASAYDEAPIIPGAPNPASALAEAVDMLEDYMDSLSGVRTLILLWSLKSRPRPSLRMLSSYIRSSGVKLILILTTNKRPAWLNKYFGEDVEALLVRWNTSPERLGLRLMRILEAR